LPVRLGVTSEKRVRIGHRQQGLFNIRGIREELFGFIVLRERVKGGNLSTMGKVVNSAAYRGEHRVSTG